MSAEVNDLFEAKVVTRAGKELNGAGDVGTDGYGEFVARHIGPDEQAISAMLKVVGCSSLEDLIAKTVPASIRLKGVLNTPAPVSEFEILAELRALASKNQIFRSYLGFGYSDCITPGVILRNIMENPGWYTAYTPYQAEISQGRLEALVNFQTMITDLTGMEIANASLLDEGTAAAEAMTFCYRLREDETPNRFFISEDCHPQTIDVVSCRAIPLGIEVVRGDPKSAKFDSSFFGALVQYPATDGKIVNLKSFCDVARANNTRVVVAADLLSLTLLVPPGEWGADVVVGNSQRFGVPLAFGGPHAAFFATRDEYKREMPGRVIGVSRDAAGNTAYRLSIQTREQHIRREKATSNICTAQVLLAVMASMYAVYHGPRGIKKIADRIAKNAATLAAGLEGLGYKLRNGEFFDTLRVEVDVSSRGAIQKRAEGKKINFREFSDGSLGIALDETVGASDVEDVLECFALKGSAKSFDELNSKASPRISASFQRKSPYLTHPVFNRHHSETELLRYINRLQSKDLSLTTSMIPLGSCTMKLNATVEMIPVTWPEFASIHPFAPLSQSQGYQQMFHELEQMLCQITGFDAFSLQPNAGSAGEYTGLLVIRAYHLSRGEGHRKVCLIPQSAHGTNPASAAMAGMEIVIVKCDDSGNVDVSDLRSKAEEHSKNLAALMVTYPSTHGVFEESIREICDVIHKHGGQVYMDGANLNAQVGLCRPADFGADVCHSNLHKTFCIPHGGGGPGMGPIGVKAHLAPFLPGHPLVDKKTLGGEKAIGAVSAAPWGSAAILPIPYVYMRVMGGKGLTRATEVAILSANYIATRLEPHFPVLYRGKNGTVAHECILDVRKIKRAVGIEAADIGKRLMDYGFHAPTVSFPVVETLMVEPTESEPKEELDRFCDAMISIRNEIRQIEEGKSDRTDNLLKNAPHTAAVLLKDEWTHPYSREQAAYPGPWLREHKYWPTVSRIDAVWGDRHLFCSCPPVS